MIEKSYQPRYIGPLPSCCLSSVQNVRPPYLKDNFRDAYPLGRQVQLVPLGRVLADGKLLIGVEDEVRRVLLERGLVLAQPLLLGLAVRVARVLNAQ